jgi:hypothetical protein
MPPHPKQRRSVCSTNSKSYPIRGCVLDSACLALSVLSLKHALVWPKELFPLNENEAVGVKIDLPHVVDDASPDDSAKGRTWPVVSIDLNGDGEKEMIVYLGPDGQTSDYGIFQKHHGAWENIGFFMGGCAFCAKENGYYQLSTSGQAGGGSTSRALLRMVSGRYRIVAWEEYERGVLTNSEYNPNGLTDVTEDGIHSGE